MENCRRCKPPRGFAEGRRRHCAVSAQVAPLQLRAFTSPSAPYDNVSPPAVPAGYSPAPAAAGETARPGNPSRPHLLQPQPAPSKFPGQGQAADLRTNKSVCTGWTVLQCAEFARRFQLQAAFRGPGCRSRSNFMYTMYKPCINQGYTTRYIHSDLLNTARIVQVDMQK